MAFMLFEILLAAYYKTKYLEFYFHFVLHDMTCFNLVVGKLIKKTFQLH